MLSKFKQFIMRGNVVDLAVGIIIGAAFTTIVTSLVNDVIMPPIGLATGGLDFSSLLIVIKDGVPGGPYTTIEAAKAAGAVTINYGRFINAIFSFLIVGFAVFMLIQAVQKLYKQEAEAPAAPPAPSKSEMLLEEIRDLLKKR